VKDVTAQLKELLAERILAIRGGTHGSPTGPLLLRSARNRRGSGLPPGIARPRTRTSRETS